MHRIFCIPFSFSFREYDPCIFIASKCAVLCLINHRNVIYCRIIIGSALYKYKIIPKKYSEIINLLKGR